MTTVTGVTAAHIAELTGPIPRVTSLPSTPDNGDQVLFVVDDGYAGILWHLIYNADSIADQKWEFVGGTDLIAEMAGYDSVFTESSTAWGEMTPRTISIPLDGDYDITVCADNFQSTVAGVTIFAGYAIGATEATDLDAAQANVVSANDGRFVSSTQRRGISGTPLDLTSKFKVDNDTAIISCTARRLIARPVRVG